VQARVSPPLKKGLPNRRELGDAHVVRHEFPQLRLDVREPAFPEAGFGISRVPGSVSSSRHGRESGAAVEQPATPNRVAPRADRVDGVDRSTSQQTICALSVVVLGPMLSGMFLITEAEAAAIRAAFERGGELAAAVELRRLFPGVTDTTEARACARTIAGWKTLPLPHRTDLPPSTRR
jgi:hypothetical protein